MDQTIPRATTPAVAPPVMIGGEIPLIDVSGFLAGKPGAAEKAAAELRYAFENVGFYYLAGHGVPRALIEAQYEQAARFHAHADGGEARGQGRRAHDRLHADRREGAAQRRRAGQEAQPERGLLPAPRARRRTIPT